MFVLYRGRYPYRSFASLEEVPEGQLVYYFPEEDHPVPVIRAGDRLLYPEPSGVYRYWVKYEEPRDFTVPRARGDALVVFYDPQEPSSSFGLEVWLGETLVAREVLHQGPLALEAFKAVFTGRRSHEYGGSFGVHRG